jgi:hypothetical protein
MLTAIAASAHHPGSVSPRLILAAILVPLGYALLVLAHPLVRCPLCRGKRVTHSRPERGKRPKVAKCPGCNATGVYRMPGATIIHGFFWAVLGDHMRDQVRKSVAERTGPPEKEQES